MICPRCQNTDSSYFYLGSKGWICRRCIQFSRVLIQEEMEVPESCFVEKEDPELRLDYPLTSAQKEISDQLCELIEHRDVLIYAVCGAGKTEIVMDCLKQALRQGKQAALAVARRQVVLELAQRLQYAFPTLSVVPVCQGYTKITEGDLIVCTTHQLYRYPGRFDVLIVDEPDAFPFKGDPVLHGIASTSCKGHTVYLTATPDEQLQNRVKEGSLVQLSLMRRPHGKDLNVPHVVILPKSLLLFQLATWLARKEKEQKQAIIFVPTTRQCEIYASLFKYRFSCHFITSKSEDKEQTIARFRGKEIQFCFATTILERGITIKGIDICVFLADHGVFDTASLIQMSGRIGRSFDCPTGEGLFLCEKVSTTVKEAITMLKAANCAS